MSNHDSSKRCDFVIQNDYSLWGRDPGPGVASMRRGAWKLALCRGVR